MELDKKWVITIMIVILLALGATAYIAVKANCGAEDNRTELNEVKKKVSADSVKFASEIFGTDSTKGTKEMISAVEKSAKENKRAIESTKKTVNNLKKEITSISKEITVIHDSLKKIQEKQAADMLAFLTYKGLKDTAKREGTKLAESVKPEVKPPEANSNLTSFLTNQDGKTKSCQWGSGQNPNNSETSVNLKTDSIKNNTKIRVDKRVRSN